MEDKKGGMGMGYSRFVAMIATSTVVMFGLMYLVGREQCDVRFGDGYIASDVP